MSLLDRRTSVAIAGLLAALSLTRPSDVAADSLADGKALASEMMAQRPTESSEYNCELKLRDAAERRTAVPVKLQILPGDHSWQAIYAAAPTNGSPAEKLTVTHFEDQRPNEYRLERLTTTGATNPATSTLNGDAANLPFAGSDFWLADLGLEFLHWPQQRLTKKEMRKGRPCKVLESANPTPTKGSYSRVLTWVDAETDNPILAQAFDQNGKLLKEFAINKIKSVNGHYQLKEMEIRNDQTDSRTRLEYQLDLGK